MAIQRESGIPCPFPEQEQDPFLLEDLYCKEKEWEGEEEEEDEDEDSNESFSFPLFPSQQDLFWEDEELLSLFTKEQEQHQRQQGALFDDTDAYLSLGRNQAVDWILKVNAHYGFTALTAILAINYIDRFLCSYHFQGEKPWMIQLVAVTCLSLAAKIEETHVPLLLDLQVEDTKYVFEAKTIQRMELLVLPTLQWKMHPITPIAFLDHIIRRFGLKNHLHLKLLQRCERLLLSAVSDSRFVNFLPSVQATATIMHVIEQIDPFNHVDYQNQLLDVLKLTKETLGECYDLILELSRDRNENITHRKRKNFCEFAESSSSGVLDSELSSGDESKDASSVTTSNYSSSTEPPLKKIRRVQEETIIRHPLPINRTIIVASP